MRTSETIRMEIENRVGFFAPFFEPALENPEILENLWQHTLSAYLNNPLPVLFKEKIFARLSRYCSLPYCLVCHTCALQPLGMNAEEVLELLKYPIVFNEKKLQESLEKILQSFILPLDWSDTNQELEERMIQCSELVYLKPTESTKCLEVMCRIVGAKSYQHWLALLGYIKYAHFWVESHPEITHSGDKRSQKYLKSLTEQQLEIGEIFEGYAKQVQHERFSLRNDLIEEIHKKEQAEERLRQTQKMDALGTLARGIAHDFNNILASIQVNTEVMLLGIPEENEDRATLEGILKSIDRATNLVKQIRIFSRTENAVLKPENLTLIVQEALKMAKASFTDKIKIQEKLPKNLPALMADKNQIQQIILNLCSNAAHAMEGTGGSLHVSIDQLQNSPSILKVVPGPCLKLTVQDSGRGISSETQERIFDPFFTTKEPGQGTGLGLSVIHGIVERHHGKITVESEPEKGTSISIYFPLSQERLPSQ